MKKCVVIYNPQSGKLTNENTLKSLKSILEKYDFKSEIIYTKCHGDAIGIMKDLDSVDLVIGAGGDGTLNEIITGNLMRKEKLLVAHLPFGTANDVAKMYGLTQNYLRNLDLLLSGIVKNVDICLINNQPFVYVACMGSYVDIAYATPRKLKEKYGRLAYIIYGIKQLKKNFQFYNVKYKVNDVEKRGIFSFIFITNSNRVGGVNNLYSDIKLNDNMYEVLMCNIKNNWDIIKAIHFLKRREINNLPGFVYYKTNNLEIEFDKIPTASWCIDGEEYKENTKKYFIKINKEINMLVPTKNIEKLFENNE